MNGRPMTAQLSARPDMGWMDRGACKDAPWFADWDVHAQVKFCWDNNCPVRDECREDGLAELAAGRPVSEVRGGVKPRDLKRLRKLQMEQEARVRRLRAEVAS